MTRKHHGRIIDTSIRIKTTPMRAWEAWADPQQIANWFVDRAEGAAVAGGTMKWFFDTFGYAMDVPITEAEPGKSFVTAGEMGPDGQPYAMEITISKDEGDTLIHLVNSGFSTDPKKDDDFNGTVSGWKHALRVLKLWLERYPHRRRHHDLVVRPASYTWAQLRPLYATPEGRARWMEPDVASSGSVLEDSGPEVMLDLPGRDAIVALKAFKMGPQYMVGLDLMQWPAEGDAAADMKAALNRSLDRLVALL